MDLIKYALKKDFIPLNLGDHPSMVNVSQNINNTELEMYYQHILKNEILQKEGKPIISLMESNFKFLRPMMKKAMVHKLMIKRLNDKSKGNCDILLTGIEAKKNDNSDSNTLSDDSKSKTNPNDENSISDDGVHKRNMDHSINCISDLGDAVSSKPSSKRVNYTMTCNSTATKNKSALFVKVGSLQGIDVTGRRMQKLDKSYQKLMEINDKYISNSVNNSPRATKRGQGSFRRSNKDKYISGTFITNPKNADNNENTQSLRYVSSKTIPEKPAYMRKYTKKLIEEHLPMNYSPSFNKFTERISMQNKKTSGFSDGLKYQKKVSFKTDICSENSSLCEDDDENQNDSLDQEVQPYYSKKRPVPSINLQNLVAFQLSKRNHHIPTRTSARLLSVEEKEIEKSIKNTQNNSQAKEKFLNKYNTPSQSTLQPTIYKNDNQVTKNMDYYNKIILNRNSSLPSILNNNKNSIYIPSKLISKTNYTKSHIIDQNNLGAPLNKNRMEQNIPFLNRHSIIKDFSSKIIDSKNKAISLTESPDVQKAPKAETKQQNESDCSAENLLEKDLSIISQNSKLNDSIDGHYQPYEKNNWSKLSSSKLPLKLQQPTFDNPNRVVRIEGVADFLTKKLETIIANKHENQYHDKLEPYLHNCSDLKNKKINRKDKSQPLTPRNYDDVIIRKKISLKKKREISQPFLTKRSSPYDGSLRNNLQPIQPNPILGNKIRSIYLENKKVQLTKIEFVTNQNICQTDRPKKQNKDEFCKRIKADIEKTENMTRLARKKINYPPNCPNMKLNLTLLKNKLVKNFGENFPEKEFYGLICLGNNSNT